jgi:hypothetical protein
MKFIFADSLDYVDPHFDFIADQYAEGRQPYWDDVFPHEILNHAPYDGMLISRAIVGDSILRGSYSESMLMRFHRVGAREHLRFNSPENRNKPIFGDCGAFSYAKLTKPPYTASDTVEFYGAGRFTHGCSIDHIIFEFNSNAKGLTGGSEDSKERYDITLELASEFIKESKELGKSFTPIGVIQGWSPDSMALSALNLIKMGYRYLAIGGLVPLNVKEIHQAVTCIHEAVSKWPSVKLHLLGFAKADNLDEFFKYPKLASFDSTSPLIKAFKDSTRNYFLPKKNEILYFTAIRIPQAIENIKLKNHAKSGAFTQEHLIKLEKSALTTFRCFAKKKSSLESTLDSVIEYTRPLLWTKSITEDEMERKLHILRAKYQKTLEARPWELCKCNICKDIGHEAIIFRGSNRNRRRGIHNLYVYHNHLNRLRNL